MNLSKTTESNSSEVVTSPTNTTGDVPLRTITPNRYDENGIRRTNSGINSIPQSEITTNEKDATDRLIPAFNPALDLSDSLPPELNTYRNKKTLAQGLMDIALFSANANQLRYILETEDSNQAYFYIAATLIIISLILQVGVGLLLLMSTQYSLNVQCQREMVYKYGNYVTIGIFLITVVNIFIAAFGGPAFYAGSPPTQTT